MLSDKLELFLATFQAADPSLQQWCINAMNGTSAGASQHGQDVFIWRNLFLNDAIRGQKGYYIDSGANHYKKLSNTYFFDKCLGWDGICIEVNPVYHANHRAHRSCTLIPQCISDKPTNRSFIFDGEGGHVNGDGVHVTKDDKVSKRASIVQCNPLHEMLAMANAPPKVDLWSLDVEGHEIVILSSINWQRVRLKALLVEDFWLSNRNLDHLLTRQAFLKAHQLAIDSLWISSRATDLLPAGGRFWYPPGWHKLWSETEKFRATVREQTVRGVAFAHLAEDLR